MLYLTSKTLTFPMDEQEKIRLSCFHEALRLSDRCISTSLFLLFIAAAIAKGASGPIVLPVGSVTISSKENAVIVLFVLNFANSIRYAFLLNRAKTIGQLFSEEVLTSARLYPALATSELMTGFFVDFIVGVLTASIMTNTFGSNLWLSLAIGSLMALPFLLAQSSSQRILNVRSL